MKQTHTQTLALPRPYLSSCKCFPFVVLVVIVIHPHHDDRTEARLGLVFGKVKSSILVLLRGNPIFWPNAHTNKLNLSSFVRPRTHTHTHISVRVRSSSSLQTTNYCAGPLSTILFLFHSLFTPLPKYDYHFLGG